MIRLKKIVLGLAPQDYKLIEDALLKNKAQNSFSLLSAYRNTSDTDEEISKRLNCNSNSFYVLKSRLYDKIQEVLSVNVFVTKDDILQSLHLIPEMCYNNSRDVAIAYLEKIVKTLLVQDMHSELMYVYSTLKKMSVHSQKYFLYSQQYNKHVAFNLALEKSEEILGTFSRELSHYVLSRSKQNFESLEFMVNKINDHYSLNPSRHVEIIRNLIQLQMAAFCRGIIEPSFNVREKLLHTQAMCAELPRTYFSRSALPVLEFLFFEFYYHTGDYQSAQEYFVKTNNYLNTLLLLSNVCPVSHFLKLKIVYQKNLLEPEAADQNLLYDHDDLCSRINLALYRSAIKAMKSEYKEAAQLLNQLHNEVGFKDFLHAGFDVKLSLAYFYLRLEEYEVADNILKNIYRKIKADKLDRYSNVLYLIKVWNEEIKSPGKAISRKQKDEFLLFRTTNTNESTILEHLLPELGQRYA